MPAKSSKAPLEEYRRKRDFTRTSEPPGRARKGKGGELQFVIQKHDATNLHYDLRLEMDGVMKSWAVPKGPSLDPKVRRLAMEVEDHPMEYNDFEGTIPAGEYGGGTVMLWDVGTYVPEELKPGTDYSEGALAAYRKGKLSFTLFGERLQGSFALVRTDTVEGGPRSKWLLMKHRDEHASTGTEITEIVETSVATDRTMEEIAAGKDGKRIWHSNRDGRKSAVAKGGGRSAGSRGEEPRAAPAQPAPSLDFAPMLATSAAEPPTKGSWVYEPKYDGIRVLAFATTEGVALITRNGHDKAKQFPEVSEALRELAEQEGGPYVLDGEIVPLVKGKVGRFELLQGRMHLTETRTISRLKKEVPTALIAFDIILEGGDVLVGEPLTDRRERLEAVLEDFENHTIRISDVSDDASALLRRGEREGWEGIMAKRAASTYQAGRRSGDWLKIKLENRQEFVVGGWTEPRKTRAFFGALLLGYYDAEGAFRYAGHTGTGFDQRSLADMFARLERLERKTSPFSNPVKTNEKAHWVTPRLVVEVKFNEWTKDGKLRQPVFLGLRDDKDPRLVVREGPGAVASGGNEEEDVLDASGGGDDPAEEGHPSPPRERGKPKKKKKVVAESAALKNLRAVIARGGGTLSVAGGKIPVTNPEKVFFPQTGHRKADLLEFYTKMADFILPAMKDRALVLKRFPNGVESEAFYQQAAPDAPPEGVRVETLLIEGKEQKRLVGGNLATLLYTVQLGAISYDPWHSRIYDLDSADYTILDLDPGPETTFRRVVEVAKWVKDELDELGLHGGLKTSGSSGIHIYLPLPPETPLEAATLVAQIVATRVARKHPKAATVERMTKNRPAGTVYVDYLQNILGKTVAGVYAVRAKSAPTVSTPLLWTELTAQLDLRDFTVDTVPERVAELGDLWAGPMGRTNSLEKLIGG